MAKIRIEKQEIKITIIDHAFDSYDEGMKKDLIDALSQFFQTENLTVEDIQEISEHEDNDE